jgi:glycosyltransferase involved in cell wall biosynthesis
MIVFQCQYAADRFVGGNHLIKIGKGIVIPLGCETFDVQDINPPVGIAANNKLLMTLCNDSLFKFVYLAGFRPGKMHVWLIHAMAPVLKAHPEAHVLFCGTGEKSVFNAIVAAIRAEKLDGQISLPGLVARHEVPWLLSHCQCAVVPSRAETFGHNFLEPMFAGLPVLGTRVGIGRDIIKDGETGYGFDLSVPLSVQVAAENLLSNRDGTKKMGMRARQMVENDFTHASVALRLARMYDNVLREVPLKINDRNSH